MSAPKIYHFDFNTGALIGEGFADPDPMNKKNWLIPAGATLKKPPQMDYGMIALFKNDAWITSKKEAPIEKKLNYEDIDRLRIIAYADPLTGSDRLFSESTRMQIMGENGHEEVRARAIDRFEEIQAKYPWPSK